jgi:hypothetical protein
VIDRFLVIVPSIVLVLYVLTCVCFCLKRDWWWAVVYFGYALAMVGLIVASMKG